MKLGDITIYNNDCLEQMKDIRDESIDLILCDLPYGVLNKTNENAKWDSIIDMTELWKQYRRILKNNSCIVLFSQGMFSANLMITAKDLWKYNLVWKKKNRVTGFLNANRQPMRNHEDILVFAKGIARYNPQKIKSSFYHKTGGGKKNGCYGYSKPLPFNECNERYPTSILDYDKENNQVHSTQKPVALLRYLIRTYSDKDNTVLDNTMGSGSTMVACIREHRKGIGIELEKKYFDIAKQRIEQAQSENTIFDYL